MNNQIIIDMIKTLAKHLDARERADLYDALDVTPRYDLEEHVEIVDEAACYRVFGSLDADEADIHSEMISYLNNEGYDVIDWEDPNDIARTASTLNLCVDGYYVFEHQEDGSHLAEMARLLQECEYMGAAPMYDRLQEAGIYHGDQQLHELLAHDGMMVLPKVDRYLEDPTWTVWERDFRQALDHFWAGQGSECQSEKVKFIMNWLADQV